MIRIILATLAVAILCNPAQDCLEDWHCAEGCYCSEEGFCLGGTK